jgi:S-(hydroxymethyl)glutathione dehydrogenase/alcohol dehydrogenase
VKTRAAVLWDVGREWEIVEVEVDPPGPGEVLIKTRAAGLCHSDDHVVQGDMSVANADADAMGIDRMFPIIGGHEGSGEIVEVGDGVTTVQPGDHVSMSFIPACGRCHWCAIGRQTLCDLGAKVFEMGQITDGRIAHHIGDTGVGVLSKVGSFSEYMLASEASVVKIEPDLPFIPAALVSCGVATGWGSAVHRAEVQPGDTVVVVGCGGIGMNAVQGARMAGAKRVIAVDPVEFKREQALAFGATHTYSSLEEATPAVIELTWGRGADKTILTPGLLNGDMVGEALAATSKGGTVVVTAIANMMESQVTMSLFDLAMMNKEVKGTIFGSGNPRSDIPALLSMYREGMLKLDELVTRTYSLDEINQGYRDMRDGKNIRGVITFD